MQNNSVNKGIFYFLGGKIWVPMPVYQYENPFGCHGLDNAYINKIHPRQAMAKVFPILSISLLHSKEFLTTNFKTAHSR